MREEDIVLDSRDMKNTIYAKQWLPTGEIKAVLILVHGMSEHIGRYREMAEYLCSQGFLVAAEDMLGHGTTGEVQREFGYFTEQDAATVLVRDVHRLKKTVQEKYPSLPVFIFGHSMGAIIVRNYIMRYGSGIKGAIIMGNIDRGVFACQISKVFIRLMALFKGWHYKSDLVTYLALMRNKRGPSQFPLLSHRPEIIEQHKKDKYCGFQFSLNGYYTLVELLLRCRDKKLLGKIPKGLPILMLDGGEDQFGDYGEAPQKVKRIFTREGIKNIKSRIFKNDAHEVYNEKDRFEAFNDIVRFCAETP